MASATWKVALTMMVPMALGTMWRRTIRRRLPPMTRTAWTYSRTRSVSVSPLMSRAGTSHDTKAMTRISTVRVGWNTTARTINKNRKGIDSSVSTIRIISASTQPPKKPETAP